MTVKFFYKHEEDSHYHKGNELTLELWNGIRKKRYANEIKFSKYIIITIYKVVSMSSLSYIWEF